MYEDSPTTDLPELSQDIPQLEKSVRRIFVFRILFALFMTVLLFGLSVYLASNAATTSLVSSYVVIWVTYCLGVISASELIVEVIAIYYRPQWYAYVNFFVWNIIGQIGLLTSRQAVRGRQSSLISSITSLNPKRAMEDAYGLYQEKKHEKTNESIFNGSFIIDRYLTLKKQLKADTSASPHS